MYLRIHFSGQISISWYHLWRCIVKFFHAAWDCTVSKLLPPPPSTHTHAPLLQHLLGGPPCPFLPPKSTSYTFCRSVECQKRCFNCTDAIKKSSNYFMQTFDSNKFPKRSFGFNLNFGSNWKSEDCVWDNKMSENRRLAENQYFGKVWMKISLKCLLSHKHFPRAKTIQE